MHDAVVKCFGAKLKRTKNLELIFNNGGIINISHPILNGHSFLIFPTEHGITAVNSMLGPLVFEGFGRNEIMKFVSKQFGDFWTIND